MQKLDSAENYFTTNKELTQNLNQKHVKNKKTLNLNANKKTYS